MQVRAIERYIPLIVFLLFCNCVLGLFLVVSWAGLFVHSSFVIILLRKTGLVALL